MPLKQNAAGQLLLLFNCEFDFKWDSHTKGCVTFPDCCYIHSLQKNKRISLEYVFLDTVTVVCFMRYTMYVAVEINLTKPLPFFSANQCTNVTLAVKAVHENVWYFLLICPCKVDPLHPTLILLTWDLQGYTLFSYFLSKT